MDIKLRTLTGVMVINDIATFIHFSSLKKINVFISYVRDEVINNQDIDHFKKVLNSYCYVPVNERDYKKYNLLWEGVQNLW